jgi:hypothetical protein
VEVQLAVDREKKRSWWWYLVGVHTRHRCDASLVVVAPSRAVAAWAARPIELGHPGVLLRPIVIGPDAVPVVETEEEAARAPETAVLSAMVYGGTKAGEAIGRAALAAVANLDEERAALHTDVVLAAMPIAMRATLEKLMASGTYQYRSEFAKRYVAQGEATGEARGEARGRALAVLAVLAARSVEVAPGLRERVLACDDVSTLDLWLARAANANTAGEVVSE